MDEFSSRVKICGPRSTVMPYDLAIVSNNLTFWTPNGRLLCALLLIGSEPLLWEIVGRGYLLAS